MKKVTVNICTNPDCHVKGATLFKQLNLILGNRFSNSIALAGSDCPGHCAKCGFSQAPCANVNGRLIPQAEPADILQAARKLLA